MDALQNKVLKFIQEKSLFQEGDRVLVGYSGGPDSTLLLLLVRSLWKDSAAIYVNHQLRGEESVREEKFVRQFCEDRKIPLFVEKIEWKKKPSNLEEAARRRRFRHFEKVALEQGFQKVALAHHADDVAETFLIRLIRGSGPHGLGGMLPRRGKYVRPLLECTRSEILQYLEQNKVPFFADNSNADVSFQRNRIRAKLIPYVEKDFNPSFRDTLTRTSRWIREQNQLLSELMKPYSRFILEKNGELAIRKSDLSRCSLELRKEVFRLLLRRADPSLRPESQVLERLSRLTENEETLELPGFLMVKSSQDSIRFSRKAGSVGYFEVDVPGPGGYSFPPGSVHLNFSTAETPDFQPEESTAFLDAERASFPLYVRNWKKGDLFQPLGMKGHKKISDLLTDRKVRKTERKKIPLVFKNDDLIWVGGYQIHQEYRVTDKTRKVLKIVLVKSV